MGNSRFSIQGRNDFWTAPVDAINSGLTKNQKKDDRAESGVSLVIGCPLPANIQENIVRLKSGFEEGIASHGSNVMVKWREDQDAFHITVRGIVIPSDYRGEESWNRAKELIPEITEICSSFRDFKLQLKGVEVLGRGALSVRVSDSDELQKLRGHLDKLPGVSSIRFGGRTNKIVLGRIQPGITEDDRQAIQSSCESLRDYDVGVVIVEQLNLVHYKHTFLDCALEKVVIT